jgi:hypothetical protein
MPEWLIVVAVIWFVSSVVGRRRSCCGGRVRDPRRVTHSRGRGPGARRDLPRRGTVARPQETPEERIRREFVEGRLTLEEYEAELWGVLGPKSSAAPVRRS